MMDNSVISNATETTTTTHNELEKTTKESTTPTSKQNDQNNQNHSLTSFQSNVVSSPSASEQNSQTSTSSSSTSVDKAAVVPQSVVEAIIKQGFPALAKTTKPIPASVFSYRFASPTNNQTPYYISSDIVLSGGIAQQTRRRIVHNEVERRRKDKINGWITKLAETIPGCSQGKQSKNIVLERAVEYLSEVNSKVAQLEECQQHRSTLVLDNQALKQRLEVLQKQNSDLQELLHQHNIAIPENLACTTLSTTQKTVNVTITNEHAPKSSGQLVASDNTNVTWMTPGKTPMATSSTSTVSATEMSPSFSQSVKELLTSLSLSSASNVSTTSSIHQPAQTNYSLYTVSSIINDVPQGVVSLVNGSNTQGTTTPAVSLALDVNNTAVINNESNNVVAANIPVAVNNKLSTQTLGSLCVPEGGVILGSQNSIVQDVGPQASNGAGTVYLAGSGGILTKSKGPSPPQGVTQVILCQAPKISGPQESPSVNVPKGTFVTPVVTQSSSVINLSQQAAPEVSNNSLIIQTLSTPTVSSTPAAARSLSNKPLFSSSLNGISSTGASQKSTMLQHQEVVTLNSYVSAVPSVVATTNNPTNQGILPMAISQGVSMATDNVCVLPSNVIQPGLVINTPPRVNTIPLAPQVLSETTSKPSHLVTRNLTSGLVTLNVPTKPVGVVTGTPNTILQQPQNLVAVNIPQATLQLGCTTSATTTSCGNALVSLPTSCVNLTPSSRTAFVIVRSTQPQATLHYTIPSQAVSQVNYNVGEVRNATNNFVTLMSTRTTPSTVVQPALFQTNSGVLQLQTPISFSGIPITSSAVSETTSANRSLSSSSTKSAASTPSSQPSAKIPKSANARKRPSSRSHTNPKSKNAKQSKSSHQAVSTSTSNLTTTSSTSQILTSSGNETSNPHRNPNSLDICQHEDMLSIQNFSISSLIPSIDSQTSAAENAKSNSALNNRETGNGSRIPGDSTAQVKTSQPASTQRLSYSIDSLTGRDNVIGQAQNGIQHQQHHQQQTHSNLLSFSAESLLGSGDDLVPNIQPITSSNATTNNFNTQNTFSISAFQEAAADGTMNQTFSNFSAEALISESDLIGIPNEPQSSRSNCTQAAQSGKQTHNRTQMFSDFSAESLINSSDLGSGLSYAIDNLISRSDNNDNSIAMVSVNPNLLHTATSSMILPDSVNQPMYSTSMPVTPMLKTSVYPHSTAMPVTPILKNHSLTNTVDYTNTTSTDQTSYGAMNLTSYSKYAFSSPQKQQKDTFSYKPNGTVTLTYPTNSVTTSPTFLKHSVDSITASQHNSTSSTGAFAFNSPLSNTVACPTFNSLYFDQINTQPFPVGGNSYSNNLNKNYQGPTMGSFA